MKITPTREDYIRSIYLLCEGTNKAPHAVDLRKSLGLAKSTISERLQELVEDNLILKSSDGSISLTRQGAEIADRLTFRHRILEVFLHKKLALDKKKLHEEAHKLEHVFSDEIIKQLAAFIEYPLVCPHGKKIEYPFKITRN